LCDLTNPTLQLLKRLGGNPNSNLPTRRHPEGSAEKRSVPHTGHRTFRFIDAKPELPEKADQRVHHPLPGFLGSHEHAQIVRVANERVTASLQLFVDFI